MNNYNCFLFIINFVLFGNPLVAQKKSSSTIEVKLEEELPVRCTETSNYYGLDFITSEKWQTFLVGYTGYLEVPHMNGSVNALIKYKNGLRDGPFYIWSKSNNLISYSNYIDGKLEGYKYDWYDSGVLASEEYNMKGIRENTYSVYSSKGELEAEIEYINGEIKSEKRFLKGVIQTNYVIRDGHKYGIIGSGYCFSKHKK